MEKIEFYYQKSLNQFNKSEKIEIEGNIEVLKIVERISIQYQFTGKCMKFNNIEEFFSKTIDNINALQIINNRFEWKAKSIDWARITAFILSGIC